MRSAIAVRNNRDNRHRYRQQRAVQPDLRRSGHNRWIRTTWAEDPLNPGSYIEVPVNTRGSLNAIALLVARGIIEPFGARVAAAQRFQWIFDQLNRGGMQRGRDPSTVGRSIGAVPEPISDKVLRAGEEYAALKQAIGRDHVATLVFAIGWGMSQRGLANVLWPHPRQLPDRDALGYARGAILRALDALISYWGMEVKGRFRKNAVRASHELSTGPSFELSVGARFGDVERVEVVPRRD